MSQGKKNRLLAGFVLGSIAATAAFVWKPEWIEKVRQMSEELREETLTQIKERTGKDFSISKRGKEDSGVIFSSQDENEVVESDPLFEEGAMK